MTANSLRLQTKCCESGEPSERPPRCQKRYATTLTTRNTTVTTGKRWVGLSSLSGNTSARERRPLLGRHDPQRLGTLRPRPQHEHVALLHGGLAERPADVARVGDEQQVALVGGPRSQRL